jgi:hypothetical protein
VAIFFGLAIAGAQSGYPPYKANFLAGPTGFGSGQPLVGCYVFFTQIKLLRLLKKIAEYVLFLYKSTLE